MDIIIDANGQFDVRFDGVSYNSCTTDVDCPGQLVCNRNASWSRYPELCTCPLTLGRTGSDCNLTNISGWVLISVSCLASLIALVSFLIGVYSIIKVFTTPVIKERVPRHSALFTTLVLTVLASLCIMLQTIYQIVSHFVPRTTVISVNSEPSKQSVLVFFNLATTTLSFFFAITAALNVSLVLIEIADRVNKGSSKIHVNVFVYRKFLGGYVFAFGIIIIILAVTGYVEWSFVAAAPAVFFIAVTFFIGWFRLSRLFNNDLKSNGASASRLQATMRNIRTTTLGISFCATGMIISAILQVVLESFNRPDGSYGAIPGRIIWVFAATIMFLLARYTHLHVHGKAMSSKRSSQPNDLALVEIATPDPST